MPTQPAITLNPALDAGKLARRYKRAGGRLQIRDFLAAEAAEWTYETLAEHTPWGLVYNAGDRVEVLSNEQLRRTPPEQLHQLAAGVMDRARTQYQFLYHVYAMTAEYMNGATAPILRIYEFLNRPATLDWLRALTGRPDIRWASAQATLFGRGHFLKSHSDLEPHANRRAVAYVLNFTRLWERDWGGYLQFYDEAHDIELAWRPIFNALNLFSVPHDHSVGLVVPFAGGRRMAVTGWLMTDDPPGPFGRLA
jgi:Rps23 Pro-64 3,4-dihydroxylase Tpa1-like proline 4-hydroxylase